LHVIKNIVETNKIAIKTILLYFILLLHITIYTTENEYSQQYIFLPHSIFLPRYCSRPICRVSIPPPKISDTHNGLKSQTNNGCGTCYNAQINYHLMEDTLQHNQGKNQNAESKHGFVEWIKCVILGKNTFSCGCKDGAL